MRASGLATGDLLKTLFRAALLLAVLTFVVGEALVPFTERMGREMRAKALSTVIAQSGFDSGLWVKDGRSFINIRTATPDAPLQGVRIYKFNDRNLLESVTDARQAEFELPDVWHLQDVVRTVLDGDHARVENSPTAEWRTSVTPTLLSALMVSPERMSLLGLVDYTRHLSENKQKPSATRSRCGRRSSTRWRRLSWLRWPCLSATRTTG